MSTNYLSRLYNFEPNLDAYFERINYTGSREPTAENLRNIQWHHLRSIPFENLDVHMYGGKVSIDPPDIEKKIIFNGRGGYCYEQNIYCMWVLRALGYLAAPILSRNRWMKPLDIITPTTHIVLKVTVNDILYLFDVGYSANISPYPLEILTENEQPTALETHRILKLDDGTFMNQIFIKNEWKDVFVFSLSECHPYDWEIGNFYVSNCMRFNLCENIVLAFCNETTRYTLLNNIFTTRHIFEETSEVVEIWTESEYLKVLREVFKIKLPESCKICPRMITWVI